MIYSCTNIIDGKVYIGQTIKTLEKRRKEHYNNSKKDLYWFHHALLNNEKKTSYGKY
jgi:hypothetical protein